MRKGLEITPTESSSETVREEFGGVTALVHPANRRAAMIAVRQLTQPISATPLRIQRQLPRLPILDLAAEIRWRLRRFEKVRWFWTWVQALASIVFLPLVLSERPEE
jgi:hypothetical protein